ncbi:hypothetical protein, partial [Frankia sp. CpI1-P]
APRRTAAHRGHSPDPNLKFLVLPRALTTAVLLAIGSYVLVTRDFLVISMVLAEIARAVLAASATRSRGGPRRDSFDTPPPVDAPGSPDTVIRITSARDTLSITIELTRTGR